MSEKTNKITMDSKTFQEIVNRLKQYGKLDDWGNRHLGHWTYRIEDGGMTQVVVNSDIGFAYVQEMNNEVVGYSLRENN